MTNEKKIAGPTFWPSRGDALPLRARKEALISLAWCLRSCRYPFFDHNNCRVDQHPNCESTSERHISKLTLR